MSEDTSIEWADSTFNPWIGCTKVSPGGCANCYAEVSTPARVKRAAGVETWGPHGQRQRTSAHNWKQPLAWERQHEAFFAQHGRRRRVFCASLADVFDNAVDPQWREDLFALIAATPNLDWLLLTKRIGNVVGMVPESWLSHAGWPKHVRLMISVVNQTEADRDIPKLVALGCPNGLSLEPLVGPISLRWLAVFHESAPYTAQKPGGTTNHLDGLRRLHWVIAGGESGHGARPMHPDWACGLRDECAEAGVPFLFKQWGEWRPISEMDEEFMNRMYRSRVKARLHQDQGALDDSYGRDCTVDSRVVWRDGSVHGLLEPMSFLQGTGAMQTFKVGKKAAGRLLAGEEHNGFPTTSLRAGCAA